MSLPAFLFYEGVDEMKGINYKRDNIPTRDYLTKVLNDMKNKMTLENNLEIERQNAKKLENFFNTLAYMNTNSENFVESACVDENIKKPLASLNLSSIWSLVNKRGDKQITGVAFEKYLKGLINKVMERSKEEGWIGKWNRNYVIKTGSERVDMYKNIVEDLSDDIVRDLIKDTYQRENERIKNYVDEAKQKGFNPTVEGKIDVAIKNVDFKIDTGKMPPALKEIFELLKGATFSAKAYATTHDVQLGQTNSFRVFLAVTQGDTYNRVYHWYRMLSCMDAHKDHEAAFLFYQIRYIYELTGYGQQYIKNKINEMIDNPTGAKYLIYYHPGSGIKVMSTKVLLNNFLKMVADGSYFEKYASKYEGNYSKEYALGARLKLRLSKGEFEFE